MKKLALASIIFPFVWIGIFSTGIAYAQPREVPLGETTYEQAYVPCGYADTKDSKGTDVWHDVPGPVGPDGKATVKKIPGDGIVDNPCQFTHIIELAKRLIMGWIIAGVIIATMGFAYAGFLYITAMGAQEKISHAHSIFVKTFWGFVFMLSAWLIAYTMETIFLSKKIRCDSFLTTPEDRVKLGC